MTPVNEALQILQSTAEVCGHERRHSSGSKLRGKVHKSVVCSLPLEVAQSCKTEGYRVANQCLVRVCRLASQKTYLLRNAISSVDDLLGSGRRQLDSLYFSCVYLDGVGI